MRRPLLNALLAGGMLSALVGCAAFHPVGPDYHAPATPDAKLATDHEAAFSSAMPDGTWWRLYDDQNVDAIVEAALANNRDLRKAAANLERVRGALEEAEASALPSTTASLQAKRSRGQVYGLTGLHETDAFSDMFQASYQLDLFGRIRRSVEAAQATVGELQATYESTQITVVADTVRSYTQACDAGAQLGAAHEALALDDQLLGITRRQAAVGALGAVDVARAEAQRATTEATLAPLEAQRRTALSSLAVMMGRVPEDVPETAKQCVSAPAVAQVMPVGDARSLLQRRPDVREAERALAAATAQIGIATADLYPDISLSASLGGAGASPTALRRKSGRTWSLGPLISWTFPNQVAARANIRQASAGADAALASFDAAVLNALKETDNALQTYARELDHQQLLVDARDADNRALEQTRKLYNAGATDLTTMLDAQRTSITAQREVVVSQGAISSDQIALFLALAGTWPTPKATPSRTNHPAPPL